MSTDVKTQHPMSKVFEFAGNMANSIVARIETQKDPVIRYTLLLNTFNLLLDTLRSYPLCGENIDESIINHAQKAFENLQKELDGFSNYIINSRKE